MNYTTEKASNKKQSVEMDKNFFDPSKSSPPNFFMMNLQMRIERMRETNFPSNPSNLPSNLPSKTILPKQSISHNAFCNK